MDFLKRLRGMLGSSGIDQGNGVTTYPQQQSQPLTFGQAPAAGGGELGFNLDTGQAVLQGLGDLSSLWSGNQAAKLAKDQFKFTKNFANKNLANQTKSYNTALSDRLTARGVTQGDSAETTREQIEKNRL
jgi:hypothetical protein